MMMVIPEVTTYHIFHAAVLVAQREAAVAGISHPHLNDMLMVTGEVYDHHREEVVLDVIRHSQPQAVNGISQAEAPDLWILCHLTRFTVQEADALTVACQDVEMLTLAHHHVLLDEILIPVRSLVVITETHILIVPASDSDLGKVRLILCAVDAISILLVMSGNLCLQCDGILNRSLHDLVHLIVAFGTNRHHHVFSIFLHRYIGCPLMLNIKMSGIVLISLLTGLVSRCHPPRQLELLTSQPS